MVLRHEQLGETYGIAGRSMVGREFFWVSPGLSSSLGEVFVDELDGDGSLADG